MQIVVMVVFVVFSMLT